jgi:16S rRNA (guanine527-N7)-methyltransferase
MAVLLPPVAEYGNRASSGPMRKPASPTDDGREDRNATCGSISMSGAEHLAAARSGRAFLERDLRTLAGVRLDLPPGALDRLERYVALLLAANERVNLTRVVDPEAVARLHLLDALVALPLVDEIAPDHAIDLGSGGGVPGIPLAIARAATHWLLVDSAGKKVAILREMIDALGLANVEVVAARAEALGRDPRYRERARLVTARACAALPVLAELAMPLLGVGGVLLAWKGPLSGNDDEVRRGRTALGEVGGGRVAIRASAANLLGGHTLVRAEKLRPTPPRFPRRPGEPGRRPLG